MVGDEAVLLFLVVKYSCFDGARLNSNVPCLVKWSAGGLYKLSSAC